MAHLSDARRVALSLTSRRRRQDGRMRDLARQDEALAALAPADRALAFRLAMGATSATGTLDALLDERLRRPSALEPRVRDALRLAAYEICYLDTPGAVAASQGVELVRSVSPRAAGLANAVLRRLVREVRPRVDEARAAASEGRASLEELSLLSCLPAWLVGRIAEQRGDAFAQGLCLAQLEPAPVYVAANGMLCEAGRLGELLEAGGMRPEPVAGLPGSYLLGEAAPLSSSRLVEDARLVVADLSAQLVCRIAAPQAPCDLLEVGQGRATKSILMAGGVDVVRPTRIDGVDSVPYKVRLARRRMQVAGLGDVVFPHELDGCSLGGNALPAELDRTFGVVLVDAPCSGTGTMRRHPEIASSLTEDDVRHLTELQARLLAAAAARVEPGGTLVYATCSVLRDEDEAVVEAFLESEVGSAFRLEPMAAAPACERDAALGRLVSSSQTPEGALLTAPAQNAPDGHFCARLLRTV